MAFIAKVVGSPHRWDQVTMYGLGSVEVTLSGPHSRADISHVVNALKTVRMSRLPSLCGQRAFTHLVFEGVWPDNAYEQSPVYLDSALLRDAELQKVLADVFRSTRVADPPRQVIRGKRDEG